MSLPTMVWVMKHSPAKVGARLVLLVLAEFAHDDGSHAYPSIDTIAERTRLSRRAAITALQRLEADGLIERTGKRPSGTIEYRILMGVQKLHGEVDDTEECSLRHERGADSAPDPSTEPTTDPGTSRGPIKLAKIGGQNLGFNALAAACGVDTRNVQRVRELTKALKEIRVYVAQEWDGDEGEPFERHVASEITRRAALYRDAMRAATLTPLALAKWWHDVAKGGPRRGPAAADFPQYQDDL